jgi:hypothetical protein
LKYCENLHNTNFFFIVVPKKAIDKLMQQNYELARMINQVIERQKSIEERLINLENDLHSSQTFSTEKDFIEVLNISKFFEGFQNILIVFK